MQWTRNSLFRDDNNNNDEAQYNIALDFSVSFIGVVVEQQKPIET